MSCQVATPSDNRCRSRSTLSLRRKGLSMGKGGVKRSREAAEDQPAEGTVEISNVMYLG